MYSFCRRGEESRGLGNSPRAHKAGSKAQAPSKSSEHRYAFVVQRKIEKVQLPELRLLVWALISDGTWQRWRGL